MIDILDIPSILRRHVGWLLVVPVVFTVLALVFLVLKTPVYRTSAELIVQPDSVQVLANEPTGSGTNQTLQGMELDSQAYVINSAPVLNEVANRLDLDEAPGFFQQGLLAKLSETCPAPNGPPAKYVRRRSRHCAKSFRFSASTGPWCS
ncbi:Wzz/FepE/Etk N-terminal domain-containing protein [Roseibium salinum]|uniref:Wzz/FepE/Etk N-terminal domain-containing protein n=1 Tax=Roseibium salinum TaxID=1604349 RepID=UPI003617265E